jgi:hypothetical protein
LAIVFFVALPSSLEFEVDVVSGGFVRTADT